MGIKRDASFAHSESGLMSVSSLNSSKPIHRFRAKVLHLMQTGPVTGIMLAATVFALWGSDVYELINPDISHDTGVGITVFICFLLFSLEFLVMTACKDGYPLTFFFWLDFVAAVSLLPDVLSLFGISTLSTGGGGSSLTVARAGRAARAGTRAARIVRVIKLLTLVRKKKEGEEEMKESKIGGQLADLITQKVIVIVGAMLIATSLLDLIATSSDFTFQAELENLEKVFVYSNSTANVAVFNDYFARFVVDHDVRAFTDPSYAVNKAALRTIVSGSPAGNWPGFTKTWLNDKSTCGGRSLRYINLLTFDLWCTKDNANDLRDSPSEFETYTTSSGSTMILDQKGFARGQALVNVIQILFIVILLGVSSALFNSDAETLVIRPLSKMAALVQRMSANPLAEIKDDGEGGDYETDFVEAALKKFGKLLQVAFGEAGSEIIGQNMSNGGELNFMIAGRKMDAIFGFVVIFHFSECTECLQEDIMTFVNQVAEYIHINVAQNEGFTNKNIGEAWLLAWRMPTDGDMTNFTKADSALKSFVRTSLQTWFCPKIRQLTEHPKIQEKIPGYRISMGFGLHVGWAIQGAIGSPQKIDASFLSPNVNLASRLEAANHQFNTVILLSGQVHALLSPMVQSLCRKLDRITVKGSAQPMEIYTYDVPFNRFEDISDMRLSGEFWQQFAPWTSAEYRVKYSEVVDEYLGGRWDKAKALLDGCLAECPDDGPAQALDEIMSRSNFVTPANWPGYRELTEK